MGDSPRFRWGGGPVAGDAFWPVLHELRTRELRRMPPGAKTILSGGCNGAWYFDWVRDNYPSVQRHIGIEAYIPRPENLPGDVEWIVNTLGDMRGVATGDVDLVFAGQTVEHLWPEEIAGFLAEAYRVLKPGGWIVLDSPNRRWTHAYNYVHPEHTMELTVDEILAVLAAAGFDVYWTRGVWLCYDSSKHRLLPLGHEPVDVDWSTDHRVIAAEARPEDSFVWWVEARRSARPPDPTRVWSLLRDIYAAVWNVATSRMSHSIGELVGDAPDRWVHSEKEESGILLHGPNVPMRAGRYLAEFRLALPQPSRDENSDEIVAMLEVCAWNATIVIAQRPIVARELSRDAPANLLLFFEMSKPTFGLEFRVHSTGAHPLAARFRVDVREGVVAEKPEQTPPDPTDKGFPLRYRLADRANRLLKGVGPIHQWLKRRLSR